MQRMFTERRSITPFTQCVLGGIFLPLEANTGLNQIDPYPSIDIYLKRRIQGYSSLRNFFCVLREVNYEREALNNTRDIISKKIIKKTWNYHSCGLIIFRKVLWQLYQVDNHISTAATKWLLASKNNINVYLYWMHVQCSNPIRSDVYKSFGVLEDP